VGNQIDRRKAECEEKMAAMRSQASKMLKVILDGYAALKTCRDADRQGMRAPDLPGEGNGEWEKIVSSESFEEIVRFWGFESVEQLFSMPEEQRIGYYDKAVEFIESIFGPEAIGLDILLKDVATAATVQEQLLLQLKAEDIEKEVAAAFGAMAQRHRSSID